MRPKIFPDPCPPRKEGAGKTGCTLQPEVSCACSQGSAHTSIQIQRSTPAFPAQWLYGLERALPGDEFVLSPSQRIKADQPGWADFASAADIRTDAGTTRLHRYAAVCENAPSESALQRRFREAGFSAFRLRAVNHSRETRLRHSCAPTAARVHRIPTRFRDDRDSALLSGETGGLMP